MSKKKHHPIKLPDSIETVEQVAELLVAGFDDWEKYGYVNVTTDESGDLTLFNYSAQAQYSGFWKPFEIISRGLIINNKTGEIVARPFDKFFNWLEGGRKAGGHIVTVTEKRDGSMGVLYRHQGDFRIATRGSFTSPQAIRATQILNDYYDLSDLPDELTLIFEIIYPGNRIVVDYGDLEELTLLAARNRYTGEYVPHFPDLVRIAYDYGFPLPEVYNIVEISELLERTGTLDVNNEGYVVLFSDGSRWKFKGDQYLEMHKLISSLTPKRVLSAIEANSLARVLEIVPDEYYDLIKSWEALIKDHIENVLTDIETAFDMAPKDDRKQYAIWVKNNHPDLHSYMFARMDEKDLLPIIIAKTDWSFLTELRLNAPLL